MILLSSENVVVNFLQQVFLTFLKVWKFNIDTLVRYLQMIAHSTESFLRFIGRIPEVVHLVRDYLLFLPSYLTTIILILIAIAIVSLFLGR